MVSGVSQDIPNGDALRADIINHTPLVGDPVSPAPGDVWYDSVTGKFRGRQNGLSVDLIGVSGVVAPVATRVYRSTNQSISSGASWTDLVWDTSAYQLNGTFWSSGASVAFTETAYWQVFVEATFDGTGLAAPRLGEMQVIVNGATVIGSEEKQIPTLNTAGLFVMAQRLFNAGDTVKVQVRHADTGALNIINQFTHSPDIILTKLTGAQGPSGSLAQSLIIPLLMV